MTLIKTSVLSAISTGIRILSGVILNKFIAVYAGPSGLASIAQFQNFITLIQTLSGDFLKTAVTKYTAQFINDKELKYAIWSSASKIQLVLSIFFFFLLFISADHISTYLFSSSIYALYIRLFGLFLPLFVFNSFLLSILNGERDIKSYIILNIILSLISMSIVSLLLMLFKIEGGLIGYILAPSIMFFVSILFLKPKEWFSLKNFNHKFDISISKKLLAFGIITFTSITASTLSLLYIRSFISETFSMDESGYWQAIWALSQIAQSLIITSLSTYLLPVLAAAKTQDIISEELKKGFFLLIPVVTIISGAIYFLRDFIIIILYTELFKPMESLFLWQMIGNVAKVSGWLIGYLIVAKAMVKTVIATEVIFAFSFIVMTRYFCQEYGLIGVTYAYSLNALLHFTSMTVIYFMMIKNNLKVLNG